MHAASPPQISANGQPSPEHHSWSTSEPPVGASCMASPFFMTTMSICHSFLSYAWRLLQCQISQLPLSRRTTGQKHGWYLATFVCCMHWDPYFWNSSTYFPFPHRIQRTTCGRNLKLHVSSKDAKSKDSLQVKGLQPVKLSQSINTSDAGW